MTSDEPGITPLRLRTASVARLFPSEELPERGVFIQRRLQALAQLADVRVIQPMPWFPFFLRKTSQGEQRYGDLRVQRKSMFYIPRFLKRLDGYWLARSITPLLRHWRDEGEIEVVDAHFGFPEGVGAVIAARKLGLPVFITVRGNEERYLQHPAIGRQLVAAMRSADGIICVSHSLARIVAQCGVLERDIRVVPNAVDADVFSPGSKCEARRALCLAPDRLYLISVGGLIRRKGHHHVIDAVASIRTGRQDVELIIIGGPAHERDYPSLLERQIRKLELTGCVHMMGKRPPQDVANWLRAADVFVLPTAREGCCNAVLEALACGLPVVTTPVGDNGVFVKPTENGYLVPIDDVGALSHAIQSAVDRPWDSEAISKGVANRGWHDAAQEVVEFFRRQLSRDRSSGLPTK